MNLRAYQTRFYQQLRSGSCPVHSNNYFSKIYESLSEIFLLSKKLLGEHEFTSIVEAFSFEFSFQSSSRYFIGDHFPKWLEENRKLKPEILDLLRFELCLHQIALHGKSLEVDHRLIESWLEGAPELSASLNPTCVFFHSHFDIDSILGSGPNLKANCIYLLGLTSKYEVDRIKLDAHEHLFLTTLKDTKYLIWIETLPKHCALNQAQNLASFLSKIISLGWLQIESASEN